MPKVKCGPQTWLFPMPALLVGAIVGGKPNFLTVAWGGIACAAPPMLSLAIRAVRHTLIGIREHRVFSVNVPSVELCKKVDYCGVHSGKQKDKSSVFTVFYNTDPKIPLIEECPFSLECKVVELRELGSHVLVIGQIMETHIDEALLEDGKPLSKKLNPLIYSPGMRQYFSLGEFIADAHQG